MNFLQVAEKNRFSKRDFTCTCICEKQKHRQSHRKEPRNRCRSVRRTRWPEPAKRHHIGTQVPDIERPSQRVVRGYLHADARESRLFRGFRFSASSRDRYILPRFPVRTCGAAFPCVRPRNALTRRSGPPRRKAENRGQLSTSRHGSPESGTERIKIGQGWQRCQGFRTAATRQLGLSCLRRPPGWECAWPSAGRT